MITIWMLGFSLISFCMGVPFLGGLFASIAILSWLCAFTYHAFIEN